MHHQKCDRQVALMGGQATDKPLCPCKEKAVTVHSSWPEIVCHNGKKPYAQTEKSGIEVVDCGACLRNYQKWIQRLEEKYLKKTG